MNGSKHDVYRPSIAMLDEIREEIVDVKTFYWHFEDPKDQEEFRNFMPGQFAMVSILGSGEMALSLPPSPTEERFFFTSRRVGRVTAEKRVLISGERGRRVVDMDIDALRRAFKETLYGV